MGKGWLFGKPSQRGEQQLKNTLMAIGSQGKKWRQFDELKMIGCANHLNLENPGWIEYIITISERLASQKGHEHSGNPHH